MGSFPIHVLPLGLYAYTAQQPKRRCTVLCRDGNKVANRNGRDFEWEMSSLVSFCTVVARTCGRWCVAGGRHAAAPVCVHEQRQFRRPVQRRQALRLGRLPFRIGRPLRGPGATLTRLSYVDPLIKVLVKDGGGTCVEITRV